MNIEREKCEMESPVQQWEVVKRRKRREEEKRREEMREGGCSHTCTRNNNCGVAEI